MLQNSDPAPTTAAETRVSTHALTEALASIDARRTREAFARVGTVTLAEGLQDTGVEATPAEVYAEIEMLREADAAQEEVKQHQRRLKMIMKAEIISALLCFLALFGFQRTLQNPAWQQAQQMHQAAQQIQQQTEQAAETATDQAQEFKRLFALTQGPHPEYIISEVSLFQGPHRNGEALFPRYWLPDGSTVYEDIASSNMSFPPNMGPPESIEFLSTGAAPRWNRVSTVSYDGVDYLRGWVRKADVARMLKGQGFSFFLAPLLDRPDQTATLIPVTIAKRSIAEKLPTSGFMPNGTNLINIPSGSPIHLDSHAWEQSKVPQGGS